MPRYTYVMPDEMSVQRTLDTLKCSIGECCDNKPVGWGLIEQETDRGIFEIVAWLGLMELVDFTGEPYRGEVENRWACVDCGVEKNDQWGIPREQAWRRA